MRITSEDRKVLTRLARLSLTPAQEAMLRNVDTGLMSRLPLNEVLQAGRKNTLQTLLARGLLRMEGAVVCLTGSGRSFLEDLDQEAEEAYE